MRSPAPKQRPLHGPLLRVGRQKPAPPEWRGCSWRARLRQLSAGFRTVSRRSAAPPQCGVKLKICWGRFAASDPPMVSASSPQRTATTAGFDLWPLLRLSRWRCVWLEMDPSVSRCLKLKWSCCWSLFSSTGFSLETRVVIKATVAFLTLTNR